MDLGYDKALLEWHGNSSKYRARIVPLFYFQDFLFFIFLKFSFCNLNSVSRFRCRYSQKSNSRTNQVFSNVNSNYSRRRNAYRSRSLLTRFFLVSRLAPFIDALQSMLSADKVLVSSSIPSLKCCSSRLEKLWRLFRQWSNWYPEPDRLVFSLLKLM